MSRPRFDQRQPSHHSPVPHRADKALAEHGATYGSVYLTGKDARRRARNDLRAGHEPAPRYTTGKGWTD